MATKVWTRQAKAEHNALQPHTAPADIPNPPEDASAYFVESHSLHQQPLKLTNQR